MKKVNKKILLLFPIFILTGCGYGLKEVYPGNVYNSVDYNLNFYKEWNKDLNYHEVEMESESHVLDKDADKVFLSPNDAYFPDHNDYDYADDLDYNDDTRSYGQTFALSKSESSFKYGYLSKLFDGQMFCHGRYELARVQIGESGFATKTSKELKEYSYFALNFKASLDYRRDGVSTGIPAHNSSIILKINFYCKVNSSTYKRVEFTYPIEHVNTNYSEATNIYTFFGFDLEKYDISRCAGYSIEYELVHDEYIESHGAEYTPSLTHCLLLYEMFLPGSTWH